MDNGLEWECCKLAFLSAFIRTSGSIISKNGNFGFEIVTENERTAEFLCEMLETNFYVTKALQPPMTWLDSIAPSSPDSLQAKVLTTGYTLLTWHPSVDNDRLNKPTYVIYASDKYPVDTDDPHNIIASGIANTEYLYAPLYPWQRHQYFSVTAVDRYGNESESAQTTVALSPIYEQDTH